MRRIKNILTELLLAIIVLFVFEKMVHANGLAVSIISLFWELFKEFFAEDEIIKIILFLFFAGCMFGSFSLSRKEENKVWAIVTAIGGIISLVIMFAK